MAESLLGKTLTELQEVALCVGLQKFAGKQLAEWLYVRRVTSFDEMTNISLKGREALKAQYTVGRHDPVREAVSVDGTRKYLFAVGEQFVDRKFQLIIPLLSESAYKRLLKAFIYGNMLTVPLDCGSPANIPAVIVQSPVRAYFLDTDGIQMARYRLHKTDLSLTVSLLDCAVATTRLIVAGKDAVLAVHDLGYQFSLRIGIGNAPLLNGLKGIGR